MTWTTATPSKSDFYWYQEPGQWARVVRVSMIRWINFGDFPVQLDMPNLEEKDLSL